MRTTFVSSLVLVALSVVSAPASAAGEEASLERSRPASPPVWEAELAYRANLVTSAGYDPFSTNDAFGQVSLAGAATFFTQGRTSFSAGVGWEYGDTGSTARGSTSSLTMHRLSIPLTARYALTPRLRLFARAAPGAAWVKARVNDPSGPAPLVASEWMPSADLSGGAAYRFAVSKAGKGSLGWWISAEGGYGWTPSMQLALAPDLPDGDPRQTGPVDVGALTMRGPYVRMAVSLAF
jgi:hypothetical protein